MIAWETGEAGRKRQEKAARDLHRRRRSTTPSRLLGIAGVLFVSGVAVLNIVTIFQFRDNALRSASHVGETMGQAMPSAQMHAAALEQAASARSDTVTLNATLARAVSWPELGRLVIGAYIAVLGSDLQDALQSALLELAPLPESKPLKPTRCSPSSLWRPIESYSFRKEPLT